MGEAVQIVEFSDGRPILHEERLTPILTSADVRDCPVAVISMVGKKRLGKSFLLDIIKRYLNHIATSKVSHESASLCRSRIANPNPVQGDMIYIYIPSEIIQSCVERIIDDIPVRRWGS